MSRASTNVTTTTSSSSRTGTRFFPRADAAILTFSTRPLALPLTRPKTIGPILDAANLDKPISCWSDDVEAKFYPSIVPSPSGGEKPAPPPTFNERYLRPFLADNERLRLSMLWYYTRDILEETEFLAGLQEKAHFAKEATSWEFVVIGILDINVYIRLATVDLELGILPRGETLCAHTITRPPGSVFLLPSLLEDWRFRTCPYLEKGGLYAYAGVPLRLQHESGNCVSLGSLCVASSKSEDPLTKDQQQALVRLGDWIVSDLVQCARSRRQRDRHRMSELLSKAQLETEKLGSEEPIMSVLKTIYPNASITVQASKATHVELEGRRPLPISELESGLWEDIEYLDTLIAEYNHKPLPTTRTVRVIASPCESASGSSYLIVATKDFRLVFDDIDSWFVQSCAGMISQMWRKRLLVEAIEAKEKFLRGFSHQLRTPIHGILGSADLLAEELQRWNPAEYATSTTIARTSSSSSMSSPEHSHSKYLNIIKMGGRDLVSIVNSMITLNRWADIAMTDRHYAMHAVDKLENELCTALLNHTAGDTRFETSVFFTHDFPPGCQKFWMDIDVLRDSLVPLVSNAVQNSPHGIVSIHSSINLATKRLTVDIKDNGRGIPQNDQRRIFESYEKVDVHSAHAGLGLTLASRFAALLRGSVALISSTVGKGSHFRATFREVQYECTSSSSSPQSLATGLQYLPSKFYNLTSTADKEALSSSLESLLTCGGFVRSDDLEDCFVIFDVTSAEHYRERISQIPSGTVSICLVPGLEADPPFEPSDRNIIFVSGPFSTTRLRPILEQADKLAWELMSPETEVAVPNRRQQDVLERHEDEAKLEDEATLCISASLAGVSLSQSDLNTPLSSAGIVPSSLPHPLSTSSHPTALIVDDNMVNLRVVEMYCIKRGLQYKSAKDGLEAIEIFSQQSSPSTTTTTTTIEPPIELIFMDLQMPVCNGLEATQRIRTLEQKNNWTKALILVMTGQDTVADKTAATEAGADGYFVKPVVVRQLDRVIKQYFPMFEYKPKSGL